ncbi:GNAT family N-acetyltransferase [Pseudomonas sp. PDM16]|uniref:GNAT family N-acetyltransferase n=1 Tax=Pseudomonas sp. PDM16 TaxID=2769292 RepID=UPI001782B871|nr:GNAT family N-acetyltransferase [Pseudomonas sp. PDM16]MBD9413081.1 GNAT family N-acetyltransferase [Pseudomonas sp. PDM16]
MPVSRVVPADLPELTELFAGYLSFYQVPRPVAEIEAFLAARLAGNDSVLLLARDGTGTALGFVQLYPFFASLQLKPAFLLSDLYVSPAARRQGLAEALMNAARAHAEANGACGLQLETAKDNFAGQALYEKLGYVRDEVFYTYWLGLNDPA